MVDKLNEFELEAGLAGLRGWSFTNGNSAITKKFRFHSFEQAFGFMTRVAACRRKGRAPSRLVQQL